MDERLGVVSLFSGVGGMELGLERAGMRSVYQCEIDKNCRAVLERHWPGLPRWDDVRRLTPLECERLMGWPDNWTAGQSDTHRYKQCGNGVASPVAEWVGGILVRLLGGARE